MFVIPLHSFSLIYPESHLHNYFDIHVCLVLTASVGGGVGGVGVMSHFQFLSCSVFQKSSQTAAEGGEAELHRLESKTTWSESRLYILGWVTGAFSMEIRLILWRFSNIDCP